MLMLRVRTILGVDDDTVVSVTGHHCGDPDCGEPATTILLMRPGRPTNAIRVAKPLETVTEADLRAALQPFRTLFVQPAEQRMANGEVEQPVEDIVVLASRRIPT